MNLSTTYMGLKLRTPLVPSASPLSGDLGNIKRMEDAGASAVVLYSLFEEQLRTDRLELNQSPNHSPISPNPTIISSAPRNISNISLPPRPP